MTPSTQHQNGNSDASSRQVGLSIVITFVMGSIIGASLFWIASDMWEMSSQTEMPAIKMENHSNIGASMSGKESGLHSHETLAVDDWPVKPTIVTAIKKDPVGGWNLNLKTTNFIYNAAAAGLNNKKGEGHAHVYINGIKHARIYGDWFHISALPRGHNVILVTLNANDHSALSLNGSTVEHELMVMVK